MRYYNLACGRVAVDVRLNFVRDVFFSCIERRKDILILKGIVSYLEVPFAHCNNSFHLIRVIHDYPVRVCRGELVVPLHKFVLYTAEFGYFTYPVSVPGGIYVSAAVYIEHAFFAHLENVFKLRNIPAIDHAVLAEEPIPAVGNLCKVNARG